MSAKVIGHRGSRGLLPELSLAGFQKALDLGVDGIEIDVGVTADGHVVAYHDYTLNPNITRTANGKWLQSTGELICTLTLEELGQFDIGRINPDSDYHHEFPQQDSVDGSLIPTLQQIVELVRRNETEVTYCVEAKRSPTRPHLTVGVNEFAETLVSEIHRIGIAAQTIIQAFDWSVIRQIKSIDSSLRIWHLTSRLAQFNTVDDDKFGVWTDGFELNHYGGSIPKMVLAARGDVWCSDYQSLSADAVGEAHDLGLAVYCWTVNETRDFERMFQAQVDGMISDYPDRLIRFVEDL